MIFMDGNTSAFFDAQIDKLRLLRQTARGEVWLALWKPARAVVWKRIHATGLPYALLAEHPHPLWPTVLCCLEDGTDTVVVEEYAEGEPLSARLSARRFLSEREAADILSQLCDGLAVLHGLGVVHRDIKPSNLILQNGTVRLIDFDAARTIKEGQPEDTALLGTKGYAPPEQFGYGQTNARSDIYAVGVTLAKLLGPDYRGWLSPILEKCTELDPKRRYGSAAELKRAVLMRRRWAKAKITCPVVLAVLVGAGLYFWPPQSVPPPVAPVKTPPAQTETVQPPIEEPIAQMPKNVEKETEKAETEAENTEIFAEVPQEMKREQGGKQVEEQATEPQSAETALPKVLTADEEAEAFLALFKDDPEKLREWKDRKDIEFYSIAKQHLSPQEAEDAKRDAINMLRRMELGRRAEAFEKTLPKSMTRDEKGRAFNEFVFEQIEILGITDF